MKSHFLKRLFSFIRPKPKFIKLPIDKLLENSTAKSVVENFNDFYYSSNNAGYLNWRGIEIIKNPCDLWIYVEILQLLKPSVIIETGTHQGGSACFLADMCNVLGFDTKIITIDINPKWSFPPEDKNILSITGKSTSKSVFKKVQDEVRNIISRLNGNIIVILDSDHSKKNVHREMKMYGELVNIGSYMIVEDTNINGHPSYLDHGPGPWEAVHEYQSQKNTARFEIDRSKEKFLLTFNPCGYLKRVE